MQPPAPHVDGLDLAVEQGTVVGLLGPNGAGKTTVGRLLARRLKRPFHDSDEEIERRCGVKIPVIFDVEGEAGFRARESRMLAELAPRSGIQNYKNGRASRAILCCWGGPRIGARYRSLVRGDGVLCATRAELPLSPPSA